MPKIGTPLSHARVHAGKNDFSIWREHYTIAQWGRYCEENGLRLVLRDVDNDIMEEVQKVGICAIALKVETTNDEGVLYA
jgi:hypothetical protein